MFPSTPLPFLLVQDVDYSTQNHSSFYARCRGQNAELQRIRPGVYVDKKSWNKLRPEKKHLVRVCATRVGLRSPGQKAALAGESAAVVYGIPLIGPIPNKLKYVVARGSRGTRKSDISVLSTTTRNIEVSCIDHTRITSPAQTLVDLARTRSFASALASLDYALAHQLVTKEHLQICLEKQSGARGIVRARRAIELADARSESVGESLSRAMMITHHLPMPKLQEEIFTKEGILAGRVDFLWPEYGVVGEFDGVGKYQGDGTGGSRTAIDERHRENLIEIASGMRVVRWTWDDAYRDDAHGMLMLLRAVGITANAS